MILQREFRMRAWPWSGRAKLFEHRYAPRAKRGAGYGLPLPASAFSAFGKASGNCADHQLDLRFRTDAVEVAEFLIECNGHDAMDSGE